MASERAAQNTWEFLFANRVRALIDTDRNTARGMAEECALCQSDAFGADSDCWDHPEVVAKRFLLSGSPL